jgi:hypothetical protein
VLQPAAANVKLATVFDTAGQLSQGVCERLSTRGRRQLPSTYSMYSLYSSGLYQVSYHLRPSRPGLAGKTRLAVVSQAVA